MAARKPLVVGSDGLPQQLQPGDKPSGSWAKAITTAADGTFSTTIPAGYFNAAPIIRHTIIAVGATRDHVMTMTGFSFNATTKVTTLSGSVRRSKTVALGGDTFESLAVAVVLHLSAEESD